MTDYILKGLKKTQERPLHAKDEVWRPSNSSVMSQPLILGQKAKTVLWSMCILKLKGLN